jgi:hypothetical protein
MRLKKSSPRFVFKGLITDSPSHHTHNMWANQLHFLKVKSFMKYLIFDADFYNSEFIQSVTEYKICITWILRMSSAQAQYMRYITAVYIHYVTFHSQYILLYVRTQHVNRNTTFCKIIKCIIILKYIYFRCSTPCTVNPLSVNVTVLPSIALLAPALFLYP